MASINGVMIKDLTVNKGTDNVTQYSGNVQYQGKDIGQWVQGQNAPSFKKTELYLPMCMMRATLSKAQQADYDVEKFLIDLACFTEAENNLKKGLKKKVLYYGAVFGSCNCIATIATGKESMIQVNKELLSSLARFKKSPEDEVFIEVYSKDSDFRINRGSEEQGKAAVNQFLADERAKAEKARAEKERLEKEKAEKAKAEQKAREEQARLERERAEQARIEREKAERERIEKEKAAQKAREEQARIEQEKAEKARLEQEKAAQAAQAAAAARQTVQTPSPTPAPSAMAQVVVPEPLAQNAYAQTKAVEIADTEATRYIDSLGRFEKVVAGENIVVVDKGTGKTFTIKASSWGDVCLAMIALMQ